MNLMQKVLEKLVPSGRAPGLAEPGIRALFFTISDIYQDVKEYTTEVVANQFSEGMAEDAVVNYERMYGIYPSIGNSLGERRTAVEAAPLDNGPAAPGYVQEVLQAAGFNLEVAINDPVEDLISTELSNFGYENFGFAQFSNHSFNHGYLLGNGGILQNDGTRVDPVNIPLATGATNNSFGFHNFGFQNFGGGDTSARWTFVWILQGVGGGMGSVPTARKDELEKLLLSLKQGHAGVFLRVTYT